MNGDTLACVNPKQRLVPASNMKLVSTGLALKHFGPDFRFTTTLAYSGQIVDSTLVGDLYILGGGDPTIGSNSECARAANDTFGGWAAILRRAGITRIDGNVLGDPRFFNDPSPDNMGASYEDIGTAYGTGPTGLCFFENQQNFFVSPGSAVGLNVLMVPRYPDTPWMQYSCAARTGASKSTNTLYYVCTEFGPYGEVRGSFPIDRKGYTLESANRFGAYTCAYYFWKYLNSNGLPAKGYGDVAPRGYIRTDLAFARTVGTYRGGQLEVAVPCRHSLRHQRTLRQLLCRDPLPHARKGRLRQHPAGLLPRGGEQGAQGLGNQS